MSQLIITILKKIIRQFFLDNTMEELLRSTRGRKTHLGKENSPDPAQLFSQCQSQLTRLNLKLKGFITHQRDRQLGTVLPSIQSLGTQIRSLKENIDYQPTVDEKMEQRKNLIGVKDRLLEKIKKYSSRMEELKLQVQALNINNEELEREYRENQQLLEGYEPQQQQQEVGSIQYRELNSNRSSALTQLSMLSMNVHTQLSMNEFKRSLPSLFGRDSKVVRQSLLTSDCQAKWSQVDRLLNRMVTLKSDALACSLLGQVRKEKNVMKSLLKNYQVTEKMGQLMGKAQVRQAWKQLLAIVAV